MEEKPKRTTGDILVALTKGALGAVPYAGPMASELFNLIFTPPLTKRRDQWMDSIAEGLKKLEENGKGFTVEELSKNESFITTLIYATQVAIRNHQKEKLDALRNAALNAALPNAPEEDLQMIFLGYIDSITTWHVHILKYFDNPELFIKEAKIKIPDWEEISPEGVFFYLYPHFRNQPQIFNLIIQDLADIKELLSEDNIHTPMKKMAYLRVSHSTNFGKQFIKFISSPI